MKDDIWIQENSYYLEVQRQMKSEDGIPTVIY